MDTWELHSQVYPILRSETKIVDRNFGSVSPHYNTHARLISWLWFGDKCCIGLRRTVRNNVRERCFQCRDILPRLMAFELEMASFDLSHRQTWFHRKESTFLISSSEGELVEIFWWYLYPLRWLDKLHPFESAWENCYWCYRTSVLSWSFCF